MLQKNVNNMFSRFFTAKYVREFNQMMIYAGEDDDARDYLGKNLFISLILTIVCVVLAFITGMILILSSVGLGAFILFQVYVYLRVYYKMEYRTKKAEEALPDALQLMSSNLRAGMTPYQAMVAASRKDFGPLSEEFSYATTKALGNESFTQVLLNVGKRIKSSTIERAMKLMISSLKSGGHLAGLLEDLSENISENRALRNEVMTSTRTYSMFIIFVIIVGAPVLFSISIQFVGIVTGMQAKTNVASYEFGLGMLSGKMEITTDFLETISIVALTLTSFLACMLIGVIQTGRQTHGFRYVPFIVGGSIAMFFVAKIFISNLFVSLVGQ